MDATETDAPFAEILADPTGERALAEARRLGETSPADAAALLERLAGSAADEQPALASRWLTEAASLWAGVAADPKRAARTLRTAIAIAPDDDAALARLLELYRDNGKHRALARIFERRAEALLGGAAEDPSARGRAAGAFTMLGHLLRDEPLQSPAEAIAAGAAPAETFRAARAPYVQAQQLGDALPLFAIERDRRASSCSARRSSPASRARSRRSRATPTTFAASRSPPVICGSCSIACVRVVQGGRFLGLIELVSLADDVPFAPGDEHALSYIADRYAELVAERGVVLDDDE